MSETAGMRVWSLSKLNFREKDLIWTQVQNRLYSWKNHSGLYFPNAQFALIDCRGHWCFYNLLWLTMLFGCMPDQFYELDQMILRKEKFLQESVNLLFLWKNVSMKNLPLICILLVSWDDDWRSSLEGVDMGRGCVVVVVMLSVQYSFLWMFCRSKGTENHPPFPNALFLLPSLPSQLLQSHSASHLRKSALRSPTGLR